MNAFVGCRVFSFAVIGGLLLASICRAEPKPNIILINLDAADYELVNVDFEQTERVYFPNISKLGREGLRFSNMHATTPLCGPSRACLMRGQYAHNTGILSNNPDDPASLGFAGGYLLYKSKGYTNNDMSVWVKNAGYRTLFVGKYLHPGLATDKPPGWDEFYSYGGGSYFGWSRTVNGVRSNENLNTYRTNRETLDCLNLLDRHVPFREQHGTPFFLYYAPFAPHRTNHPTTKIYDPQYAAAWPDLTIPNDSDFDEQDTSDKPPEIQTIKPMTANIRRTLSEAYRDRFLALKSIDSFVGKLLQKLKSQNEEDKTYIILTSDNGFSLGHHRIRGKQFPYERVTRVPLSVWGPNVKQNEVAGHLLGHIDLSPTITELAGGIVPDFVDGKSFLPLLQSPEDHPEENWQDHIMIENWQTSRIWNPTLPNFVRVDANYAGLRFFDRTYTEWSSGSLEHYDLSVDSFQDSNNYFDLDAGEQSLFAELTRQRREAPVKPKCTIAFPFFDAVSPGKRIRGFVEADGGVKSVDLVLRNVTKNIYWNGTAWQPKLTKLKANLKNPNNTLSKWDFEFPNAIPNVLDKYSVLARGFDSSGNYTDVPVSKVFFIDKRKPNSTIIVHRNGDTVRSPMVFSGRATDDHGVKDVLLVLRNLETGQFWNKYQWQDGSIQFRARIKGTDRKSRTWSVQFDPAEKCNVSLTSRAIDDAGNVEASVAVLRITVN